MHQAAVHQVNEHICQIEVNGMPVHRTTDIAYAQQLTTRLQKLFQYDGILKIHVVSNTARDRYAVRCGNDQEAVLLEIRDQRTSMPWLQAASMADHLTKALQNPLELRQPETVPIPLTPSKTKPTSEVLTNANPSLEEHLPNLETILQQVTTDAGNVILYTKRATPEYVYAGFTTATRAFDLTAVANQLTVEDTTVVLVKLLSDPIPILRIQGMFGANTLRTLYYRIVDGVPRHLLEVDGTVHEIDLDNDGNKEIISESGIPVETRIHMWVNDRFEEASINLTVKSTAVVPRVEGDRVFLDTYQGTPETARQQVPEGTFELKVQNGTPQLVKVEPSPAP